MCGYWLGSIRAMNMNSLLQVYIIENESACVIKKQHKNSIKKKQNGK